MNIEFVGFVHSHLNNSEISQQDIKYMRNVLAANECINYAILGIVNLTGKGNIIKWYQIDRRGYLEFKSYIEK